MAQAQTLSISTAAELFAALRSPDPGTRAGVLHSIAGDPERALQYGPHDGVSLSDALLAMADTTLPYPYWADVAAALSRLRSPSVTAFFLRMLQTSTGPESAFPAAERLALDDPDPLRAPLRQVLLASTDLHRVSAVASILRDDIGLDLRSRVRLAAADAQAPAAPVTQETLQCWLQELEGPYLEPARTRMEAQGAEAARVVAAGWDLLPPDQQPWAFGWVAAAASEAARPLTVRILTPESPADTSRDLGAVAAVVAALGYLARLGEDDPLRQLADVWTTSTDHHVRAAAAAASSRTPHAEEVLDMLRSSAPSAGDDPGFTPEADIDLLVVLIRRLDEDVPSMPMLTELLDDHRWEIRAAARQALSRLVLAGDVDGDAGAVGVARGDGQVPVGVGDPDGVRG